MICSQGKTPRPRTDFGPIDLARSFGFLVPDPQRARRVAKACRNLVRPLAEVAGSVTWIDERGMPPVEHLLDAYRRCLSVRRLKARPFLRMFGRVRGGAAALRAWDRVLRRAWSKDSSGGGWSPDAYGRRWVLYTMRERDTGSNRLKIGISYAPERRAKALKAGGRCAVRLFTNKAVAFAVEQGLHGLLYRFQDRPPHRAGVHSGGTEWYRPAARRLLVRAAAFFSQYLDSCVAMRSEGAIPAKVAGRAFAGGAGGGLMHSGRTS